MKKVGYILITLIVLLTSCNLSSNSDGNDDNEPSFKAKIAWDSGLISNFYKSHIVYKDHVYFYERPKSYSTTITKLDAATGELKWRSKQTLKSIIYTQPFITDDYVYVLISPNYIYCFSNDENSTTLTAIVEIGINGKYDYEINMSAIIYENYIYISLADNFFTRLDINKIMHDDDRIMQKIDLEILWETETNNSIQAKPVFYDDVVYVSTYSPLAYKVVELAGFDIASKERVFYTTFGGPADIEAGLPFPENGGGVSSNPIFIKNGTLYYLNWSVNAWDLSDGALLYRHVFNGSIPDSEWYHSTNSLQPIFYNGRIYNTNGDSIFCMDAATGELIWNAKEKNSGSINTSPIIYNDKLYIALHHGLFRYDSENGNLLGVDRSFKGANMGRNILYNDYMICTQMYSTADGRLIAIDLGNS